MKPTLRKRLSYLLLALLDFASACDREPVDRNSAGNSIFAAEIQPVIMPKNMSALRPFPVSYTHLTLPTKLEV